MKIERIIPKDMQKAAPVVEAKTEETSSPQKVSARVENTKEGVCHVCHSQMKMSTANGHSVMYCADHSLVMPVRDMEELPVNPVGLWGPDSSLC